MTLVGLKNQFGGRNIARNQRAKFFISPEQLCIYWGRNFCQLQICMFLNIFVSTIILKGGSTQMKLATVFESQSVGQTQTPNGNFSKNQTTKVRKYQSVQSVAKKIEYHWEYKKWDIKFLSVLKNSMYVIQALLSFCL
jgi:hypothetical protein